MLTHKNKSIAIQHRQRGPIRRIGCNPASGGEQEEPQTAWQAQETIVSDASVLFGFDRMSIGTRIGFHVGRRCSP